MHRIFVPPDGLRGQELAVTDRRAVHHLVNVLRIGVGERIECCDGRGQVHQGVVTRRSRQAVTVAIEATRREAPPALRLTLAPALIKPDRFEWMVQKATELGVEAMLPMVTARTTAQRVRGADAPRLQRWRRIAEEAAAQCGRASVPPVSAPRPLADVFADVAGQPALIPTLAVPGRPLAEALPALAGAGEAVLFIGPEGDFTTEEARQAQARGAVAVRLGPRILRSETAALAVVAIVQHRSGVL
jgi:16S rRNA (uracil1498-N3)-methyltransferase